VINGDPLLQFDISEQQSSLKANFRDYLITLIAMEIAATHLKKLEQLAFSQKVLVLATRLDETRILALRQQSFRETIKRKNDRLKLLNSGEHQLQLFIQAQQIENQARPERLELLRKQYRGVEALAGKNYVSQIQLDEISQRLTQAHSEIERTKQKIAESESELQQIPIQSSLLISEFHQQATLDNDQAM